MPPQPNWPEIRDLLRDYRRIIDRLVALEVTKTRDAPTGGYAEFLVAAALRGEVAKSVIEQGWDVELSDGVRVQVKAYVKKPKAGISPITSLDYDVVLIEFDDVFTVTKAVRVDRQVLSAFCESRQRSDRGYRVTPKQLMDRGTDIASVLRHLE